MIYFIQAIDGGPIKIGYTKNDAVKRLSYLQVGNHKELCIIGLVDDKICSESYLHRRFEKYVIRGEWFESAPEILEFIDEYNTIDNKIRLRTIREYTKYEDDYILDNYQKIKTSEIANNLDRTIQSIRTRASKLGIKKPEEFCMNGSEFIYKGNKEIDYYAGHYNPIVQRSDGKYIGLGWFRLEDDAIKALTTYRLWEYFEDGLEKDINTYTN